MSKTINELLTREALSTEHINVQTKPKRELAEAVRKILDQRGIGWTTFMEACMTRFLEENKAKKNG